MKLPARWNKILLHQVANVQTGLSKSENRKGPTVLRPYLRVANVQDGYLNLTDIKKIDVPASQLERFYLRKGDVLLTEGGDFDKLGRGSIWNGEIPECVHQNHVFAVRVMNRALLLPEFLACEIQSSRAKNYFLSCAKQTTNLASINSSQLKELPVLIPPIAEQQAIIDTSSTWDTAIQKTEQLIAATELRLHFLYQKLFGISSHTRPGWSPFRLADLLSPRKEYATPNDALPLYSLTIEDGITPKTDRYDREFLVKNTDMKQYAVVHPGDIVFNPSNLRWGAIARSKVDWSVVVSPIYEVLSIQDHQVSGALLAHELTSPRRIAYFATRTEGTLIERMAVKLDTFLRTELYLPSNRAEQDKIAALLDEAEQEIQILRRRTAALSNQKRGLMQKLLTGQWRLQIPKNAEETTNG